MTEITKTKQLVINLAADHPVFKLDEKSRSQRVREILDHCFENEQKSEVDLAELNTRVAILSSKIDLLEDVLQAVNEIKAALQKAPLPTSQPVAEQKRPALPENHTSLATPLATETQDKNIKFDVDAFFDLG